MLAPWLDVTMNFLPGNFAEWFEGSLLTEFVGGRCQWELWKAGTDEAPEATNGASSPLLLKGISLKPNDFFPVIKLSFLEILCWP